MKKSLQKLANPFAPVRDWFRRLAEKTYPFTERDTEGNSLFLDQAYWRRWDICDDTFGKNMPHIKCWRITLWREMWHLLGGVFVWMLATGIHFYIGRPYSYILPIAIILFMAFEEFVVDGARYNQPFVRGLLDWGIWVAPSVYFLIQTI